MESLFDVTKIDLVALSADSSTVCLYNVSDFAWTGSDAQIGSLQAKIQSYVGYALDGQMAAAYPETRDLPWRIVIRCRRGAPDARGRGVGRALVRVPGNELGDAEDERDLDGGEQREPEDDQQHGM